MIEFERRKQHTITENAIVGEMMKRFIRARARKSYLPITPGEIELLDLLLNGEQEKENSEKLKAELDAAILNIDMEDET